MFSLRSRMLLPSLILIGLVLLTGCQQTPVPPTVTRITATGPPAAATSAPAATAAPTQQATAPPTEAPAAEPTEAPAAQATAVPATPTEAGVEVTFELVNELTTIEELDDDLAPELEQVEGILGVSGTEVTITITYDPQVITVDELREILATIGHAVKE